MSAVLGRIFTAVGYALLCIGLFTHWPTRIYLAIKRKGRV